MPSNDPIPYHAQLAKTLHGPTLALVLTYLEIHHPPPQDSPNDPHSLGNAPVMIDCDAVCADLGISRRTLHIALNCLGAWWNTEGERSRAVRGGREFINPNHSLGPAGHDPLKIYSVTGRRAWSMPRTLTLRRNPSKLANVLNTAGIANNDNHCKGLEAIGAPSSTVSNLPHILPNILINSLPNWSDRRVDRWDRWRAENGRKTANPGRMRGAKDRRKMIGSASKVYIDELGTGC